MPENIMKVDRNILIYAFRYSLGRMSSAPYFVVENIKQNINLISKDDLELFIREIKECENYGMDFDKEFWLNFVDYLEAELKSRSK